MTDANLASFAEFARLRGFKASYVTELRKAGRLVLTDDGKAVRVAESIARIAATRDPSHAAVAERHAAQREGAATTAAPTPPIAPPAANGAADDDSNSTGYSYWRERREKAAALTAERDNAVDEGLLLEAAKVEAAVANAGSRIRSTLEAMPYELAPELAALTDEAQVRARLVEAIEHALHELARQFGAVAKQACA